MKNFKYTNYIKFILVLFLSVFIVSCNKKEEVVRDEKIERVAGFMVDINSRIKLRSEQRDELLDRVEKCINFWNGIEKNGKVKVLNIFKSDKEAYTQGIELDENGNIYQATGLKGKSGIGILDKENGILNYIVKLSDNYFGEGITFSPSGVWQLTYKEDIAFLRDKKTLDVIKTVKYNTEGWGIAYDYNEKKTFNE